MAKIKIKSDYKISKGSIDSAGWDLHYSEQDTDIMAGETKLLSTGIFLEMEKNMEAQIRSRSSLALKGLVVSNSPGTIDSDYRGEIKVILFNNSKENKQIKKGDKIAQLVFAYIMPIEIEYTKILSSTDRGSKGFGSTGS
jgi:dUTP pyrophosphatase